MRNPASQGQGLSPPRSPVRFFRGRRGVFVALFAAAAVLAGSWWLFRGDATGWKASYFPTPRLQGKAAVERVDSVGFHWEGASSGGKSPFDMRSFSARWETYLALDRQRTVRISLLSKGGSRLFLNGENVIDRWGITPLPTDTIEVSLGAGRHYLCVEYFSVSAEGKIGLALAADGDQSAPVPPAWMLFPRDPPADIEPCGPATRNEEWAVAFQEFSAREEKQLGSGRWRVFRSARFDPGLTAEQRRRMEELESIGYVGGSREGTGESGVTYIDPDRAYSGLNFFTSGHAPQAFLMDMEGNVLHTWEKNFREVWPDFPTPRDNENTQFWRRAHLFENGDILAIFEGLGIIRLDKDSNLIWAKSNRAHHDLEVTPSGDILVLTREVKMLPRVNRYLPIMDDYITRLSPSGEERDRISILECLENSLKHGINWRAKGLDYGDLFHTNTLHLLDGRHAKRHAAFAEGNIFISSRTRSFIAVVDPGKKEIAWYYDRGMKEQHDPSLVEDGNVLFFNNKENFGVSSVIELDPVTKEVVWKYEGTSRKPFFSETSGTSRRLPNGNTLIVETDNGRAFEVTRDKSVAWDYRSPFRAGENGKFVASLFQMERLGPDFPRGWL